MCVNARKEPHMTGQLSHEASLAHVHEMHTRARRRRVATIREEIDMPATKSIAIRRATDADRTAVERLAGLDSSPAPGGDVLIAAVDDEPLAALELDTGAVVADPFRQTADLVALLTLRSKSLRTASRRARGLRVRPRWAGHAA
jgi:hypothetical protein